MATFSIRSLFSLTSLSALSVLLELLIPLSGFIVGATGCLILALRHRRLRSHTIATCVIIWTVATFLAGVYGFVRALIANKLFLNDSFHPVAWALLCLTAVGIALLVTLTTVCLVITIFESRFHSGTGGRSH